MSESALQSLVEVARQRASEHSSRTAYICLPDGEGGEQSLSYAEVDRRARAIAARLQDLGLSGQRVLLLYPPGLDFITAFFGCLYAGTTAVPAYPPHPSRLERTLPRLTAIAVNSGAGTVLTTGLICEMSQAMGELAPALASLRWIPTDAVAEDDASRWRSHAPALDSLAFLQYTSGSTGAPKGVMVSHRNLAFNERLITRAYGQDEGSVVVGWLPQYHDMGLIGNVLQPFCLGALSVFMPPVAFLQRPMRWLSAITRYKGNTAGGPNFAYELCVRKAARAADAKLDLSSWRVAYNGAEPVREETLERFSQAFAPYGFRRDAFFPCYGLAEATLLVSCAAGGLTRVRASRAALSDRRFVADDGPSSVPLVGCGRSPPEQEVRVVHADGDRVLPDGQIGEIWVSGGSVAGGYWGRPEATRETFGAVCKEIPGRSFLRTGDLGFLLDGNLFITGRLKDLIIVRGTNHYPDDIEKTVADAGAGLRPGCIAAFSADLDGEERLVVAAELERGSQDEGTAALEELTGRLREVVATIHDLELYRVAFCKLGAIPKTSSGKLQRGACRAAFLDGSLVVAAVI